MRRRKLGKLTIRETIREKDDDDIIMIEWDDKLTVQNPFYFSRYLFIYTSGNVQNRGA